MKLMRHFPSSTPPLWMILFGSSAVLFLVGAGSFAASGAWRTAMAGLVGALLAVLVVVLRIPTKSAGVSDPNQPPVPSEASRAFR